MGRFLGVVIILILIFAVMFILNSAVLRLLFGIDAAYQLDALTSLIVSGSFSGTDAGIAGKGSVQQGTGDMHSTDDQQGTGGMHSTDDQQGTGDIPYSAANITAKTRDEENTGENGDDYFITPEEIGLLENISLQDKLKAVSILSGVDRDILDSAVEMAGDGITYDEYDELRESAEAYMDPDDIKTLEDILDRNRSIYAQGGR